MPERSRSKPIHVALKEAVETDVGEFLVTAEEIHDLFKRQVEVDDSEDNPVLLSNFVVDIRPDRLHIFAPYTISDLDNSDGRVGLVLEVTMSNNQEGTLSDNESFEIYTDKDTILRVLDAFEEDDEYTFPAKTFLELMIEDALEGKVTIDSMRIVKDKLGLSIRKPTK